MAIGKYLDAGGKGVFDSKKLSLFSYCGQNPLIFIDPDGRNLCYFGRGNGVWTQEQSNKVGRALDQVGKEVQGAAIIAGALTIGAGDIAVGVGIIGEGSLLTGAFTAVQGTVGLGVIGSDIAGVDGSEKVGASASLAGVGFGLLAKDPKMVLMNYGKLMTDIPRLPDNESKNNASLVQPFSEIVTQSVQNDAIIKGNISKEEQQ
jgi:hypothetical protein